MESSRREKWLWKGNTDTSLHGITKTLRANEPNIGRAHVQGESGRGSTDPEYTVKNALIAKLGPRGYGRLLQRMNEAASERPTKPTRRRRRRTTRRAPVAA